jgi:hypothetical protein
LTTRSILRANRIGDKQYSTFLLDANIYRRFVVHPRGVELLTAAPLIPR